MIATNDWLVCLKGPIIAEDVLWRTMPPLAEKWETLNSFQVRFGCVVTWEGSVPFLRGEWVSVGWGKGSFVYLVFLPRCPCRFEGSARGGGCFASSFLAGTWAGLGLGLVEGNPLVEFFTVVVGCSSQVVTVCLRFSSSRKWYIIHPAGDRGGF